MDAAHLEDRVKWGLNVAARATGATADAYRPRGIRDPLARGNRFLRLPAAFNNIHGGFSRPNLYGNALWHGIFDAIYTRPGDYLVQGDAVWFIASQERLSPVLCVRANRVITFKRLAAQTGTGANNYGGVTATNTNVLIAGWPASVLAASGSAKPLVNLPTDSPVPYWTVLVPASHGVVLNPTDLMSDDLGRTAIVSETELTDLGWRLTVKQVTT